MLSIFEELSRELRDSSITKLSESIGQRPLFSFFSPNFLACLPRTKQGALDQSCITSVGKHPAAYQGAHSTKGEDADPGKWIGHKRQINIHSVESGYERREHQADGDNGQPFHDYVHVIADDR